MSGKIDVNILTTGMSSNARKKRGEIVQALKKMIESKGKSGTINYQKTFNEFKQGSNMVRTIACIVCGKGVGYVSLITFCMPSFQMITREMFEDALKDLQDDGMIVVAGRSTIRICQQ